MSVCVVFITAPNEAVASHIARSLVEHKLAACVNILPRMQSIYYWEGSIETNEEILLIAKTQPQRVHELTEFVLNEHPYSCPEVLTLSSSHGAPDYLRWVFESTER